MKYLKKLQAWMPILAAAAIAVCVFVSLGGYAAPVYAVEEPEPVVKEEEKEPAAAITKREKKEEEPIVVGDGFDKPDGTYTGTGTGFRGTITVSVQIKDGKITAIELTDCPDDGAFVARAREIIDRIIAAQSLEVDTVSGATYSSRGILRAVRNALTGEADNGVTGIQEAGDPGVGVGSRDIADIEEPEAYKDGVYTGTGTGFGGPVTVEVTIEEGKIVSITVTESSDGSSYMESAMHVIPRIIEAQSTNVDTVSGASYSSVGIIEAVRDALSKAATTKEEEEEPVTGSIPYKEGIYYGTSEGYVADITVAVVIQEQTIKAILVTKAEDDEAFLNRAKAVAEQVIKKQSTEEIDLVSGATFSSRGILEAIKKALQAAADATNGTGNETEGDTDDGNTGGDSDGDAGEDDGQDSDTGTIYKDGTYTGTAVCVPDEYEDFPQYNLTVTITVLGDRVVSVDEAAGDGGSSNMAYIREAKTAVNAHLASGGLEDMDVDAVTGATCSVKAIVEAGKQALESAKKLP